MLSKGKDVKREAQGLNSNRANDDYSEQNLYIKDPLAPYLRLFLPARIYETLSNQPYFKDPLM